VSEAGYSYVYKKDGRSVVKQMIQTGMANDNEIVVDKGLTKDDHVLLAPPSDKTGIKTVIIPGLKPIVAPTAGADTANSVTLPRPNAAGKSPAKMSAMPLPAPVSSKPKD